MPYMCHRTFFVLLVHCISRKSQRFANRRMVSSKKYVKMLKTYHNMQLSTLYWLVRIYSNSTNIKSNPY